MVNAHISKHIEDDDKMKKISKNIKVIKCCDVNILLTQIDRIKRVFIEVVYFGIFVIIYLPPFSFTIIVCL